MTVKVDLTTRGAKEDEEGESFYAVEANVTLANGQGGEIPLKFWLERQITLDRAYGEALKATAAWAGSLADKMEKAAREHEMRQRGAR